MFLLGLAIAPAVAIMLYIHRRDCYEKEPFNTLAKSFFLGALSIVPAVILEIFGHKWGMNGHRPGGPVWETALYAWGVVAFSEELCKLVVLRGYSYRQACFNEPFDGIVYSVMVSMGFAAVENLIYVLQGGIAVAIIRMFLSVPAHATFGILMGYYVGLAKFKEEDSFKLCLFGLLAAVFFHGAFDFFLFLNRIPLLVFGAFASLIVGILLSRKAMRLHNQNSPFRPPAGIPIPPSI
ncbi:MAG: PrsW family glutamic-type intramembrane protease [bacterium]